MSDIPTDYRDQLDLREQIARIDRERAHIHQPQADAPRIQADADRKRQEQRIAHWMLVTAFVTATAASFAAGATVVGLWRQPMPIIIQLPPGPSR